MKTDTINKLNQLNLDFYEAIGDEFSSTRQSPWNGWLQVIESIKTTFKRPVSVLDVGCGNARFLDYLEQQKIPLFSYVGLDFSTTLVAHAKNPQAEIISFDFVRYPISELLTQPFDLIVLFGVFHHVPSFESRIQLLNQCKNLLTDKGLIAFSTWQFVKNEKIKQKIVDWKRVNQQTTASIEIDDLELFDYALPWKDRQEVYRYCHWLSQDESLKMIGQVELSVVQNYLADGATGNLNEYFIVSPP